MKQFRFGRAGAVSALTAFCVLAGAASASAQVEQDPQAWPNSPRNMQEGNPVFPFMEGWYDNGDGTFTISFGYLNRNLGEVIEIPLGENNRIEPADLDGVQPTNFETSRQRGVFAITIPASRRDQDIWWHITNANGETYSVPGRARSGAYQLDWLARPHGSVPPLAWFGSESAAGRGPGGVWADQPVTGRVGQPITLMVNIRDESVRDPSDRRFAEPIDVHVAWMKYSGPEGDVTFARHSSSPEAGPREGPEEVSLDGVSGTARVMATFPAAGEYVMLAQIDNWGAPDSSAGDQCCWTNAYVRVQVAP